MHVLLTLLADVVASLLHPMIAAMRKQKPPAPEKPRSRPKWIWAAVIMVAGVGVFAFVVHDPPPKPHEHCVTVGWHWTEKVATRIGICAK
jgi:hypothetical protein